MCMFVSQISVRVTVFLGNLLFAKASSSAVSDVQADCIQDGVSKSHIQRKIAECFYGYQCAFLIN